MDHCRAGELRTFHHRQSIRTDKPIRSHDQVLAFVSRDCRDIWLLVIRPDPSRGEW